MASVPAEQMAPPQFGGQYYSQQLEVMPMEVASYQASSPAATGYSHQASYGTHQGGSGGTNQYPQYQSTQYTQQMGPQNTTTTHYQGPVTTTTSEMHKQYQHSYPVEYTTTGGHELVHSGGMTTYTGQVSGGLHPYSATAHSTGQQYMTGQTTSIGGQMYRDISAATETSRVVGHEYGEHRVISVTQRVDESRASIISERYVEHEIRVPKKIVREEIIEKVVVIPEKLVHEEVIEEKQMVRERIIEISKPTIIEKVIEVPEIEYVERIVEVPERIIQEKIVNQEKIIQQERIIEVPKIIQQERIVEVPDIQYREVPYERVVEVPDIREEIIIKEVPVIQYVDKPVPQHMPVNVYVDVDRNIPVPVEAVVSYEYRMPRMKPRYSKISYPVYLPRFIEIPVAVELLQSGLISQAEAYLASVGQLPRSAASLCEIETLAAQIMKSDFQSQLSALDLQSAVLKAWQSGNLSVGMDITSHHQQHHITTSTTSNLPMLSTQLPLGVAPSMTTSHVTQHMMPGGMVQSSVTPMAVSASASKKSKKSSKGKH